MRVVTTSCCSQWRGYMYALSSVQDTSWLLGMSKIPTREVWSPEPGMRGWAPQSAVLVWALSQLSLIKSRAHYFFFTTLILQSHCCQIKLKSGLSGLSLVFSLWCSGVLLHIHQKAGGPQLWRIHGGNDVLPSPEVSLLFSAGLWGHVWQATDSSSGNCCVIASAKVGWARREGGETGFLGRRGTFSCLLGF